MPSFEDPSGRGPATATLAVRGFCYLVVVALVTTFLILQSRGVFRNDLHATAVLSDVGDGLPTGSDVKVRGVLVGSVGTVESTPGGAKHVVHLNFRPEYASTVPASVKARILPSNVFGAPFVDLVPGGDDTTPLAEGAVLHGDDSPGTLQLQTAITKARAVLTAVEPAKLNTALTGMAQALQGHGAQAGSLIGRLDQYLSALNPHAETFAHDLSTLATALEGLQATAPKLLDTVDSALVTSRTIVEKQQQLALTLTGGAATVDSVKGLIHDTGDRLIKVVHESAPVVHTVAGHSTEIPLSFEALGHGISTFNQAFAPPRHWLNVDMVFTMTPFAPYTSADCPRYPGMSGPNCGTPPPATRSAPAPPPPPPSVPVPQQQPQAPGGLVGPVGSPQETDAVGQILGGSLGSIGDLLLGPLFRGGTAVPR